MKSRIFGGLRAVLLIALMLAASLATASARAAGPVYTGFKEFTCTNPTTRTSGAALSPAEIAKVELYFTQDALLAQSSVKKTLLMAGGCKAALFDVASLPAVGQWYAYGKAFDTAGRISPASVSFPFVYQAAADTRPNLARGRPVVASTARSPYVATSAVDGSLSTRWSSEYTDAQWIYVDLGTAYTIDRVVVRWETAYARSYNVQLSDDKLTWRTVKAVVNQTTGGVNDLAFPAATGRYVRMQGVTRATRWGYSIWELEAYGDLAATPCTTVETAACQTQYNSCIAACNAN